MKWLEAKPVKKSIGSNGKNYRSLPVRNGAIALTDNARTVLEKRYLRKGVDGEASETVEEMFGRISKAVAAPDALYRDEAATEVEFYNLLSTKRFFPNSPTFTGAGTPLG
ncbi:ribonucleotide-diphosphate reductase subunit alpha, partial [candidate division WWE3 bacterium]|nr:ribonucleotide-diphosphate reductase subunit alpha [candidate division WWE3 bacterium]